MKTFREFKKDLEQNDLESLDQIIIINTNETLDSYERLEESKWIKGQLDNSIRIDTPTYGAGQVHAHVYGRKGNEIGVVNFDGTASHESKFRLKPGDADALISRGFSIPSDRIVEWIKLHTNNILLEHITENNLSLPDLFGQSI